MNAIEDLEYVFNALQFPSEKDREQLNALGIGVRALFFTHRNELDPIRVAIVIPLPRNRFEFCEQQSEMTRRCAIVRCFDAAGSLCDLLAFDIYGGWTGIYLGTLSIINEIALSGPDLGEPLLANQGGKEWLASERRGIVIIDPKRAVSMLMAYTGQNRRLTVSSSAYAQKLNKALSWSPQIAVQPDAFKQRVG